MSTYRDLDLSLQSHPDTGDCLKKIDVSAVKASLKNIIFGGPYDVPFNPTYGVKIRSMIFELASPALNAVTHRKLMLAIAEFEPRVVIEDIYVGSDVSNGMNIGILFHVIGNPVQQTLNYTLERTS